MLFFHTQFTVLALVPVVDACSSFRLVFNVYTVIEMTIVEKDYAMRLSLGVCSALYSWISAQNSTHLRLEMNMHYQPTAILHC